MATSLVDPPPAASGEQAQPDGSNGTPPTVRAGQAPPAGHAPATPAAAPEHACKRCGAPMAGGQDWCLQCGAGAPDSLSRSSWRSAATVIAAVVVLVLGAAAAAVAALSKSPAKAHVVTTTVAQAPPATATTPATGATTTTPGALTGVPKTKATTPLGTVKPPKIPLTAVTPKASEKVTTTPAAETKPSTSTSTTPATSTTGSKATGETTNEESQQAAILLDTNAATTYNPYGYPASDFGDPSLAIDGDHSTAWTAQVNPATAGKMAEGLLIDLKAKLKVGVLELITSTPGMTVQVYGANGHTAPESITSPAWTPLSPPKLVKKKKLRIPLRDSSKQFTFVTLWISQAPQSSVGTAEAPGHVDVNELELYEPS
jgi:hypothetical protein